MWIVSPAHKPSAHIRSNELSTIWKFTLFFELCYSLPLPGLSLVWSSSNLVSTQLLETETSPLSITLSPCASATRHYAWQENFLSLCVLFHPNTKKNKETNKTTHIHGTTHLSLPPPQAHQNTQTHKEKQKKVLGSHKQALPAPIISRQINCSCVDLSFLLGISIIPKDSSVSNMRGASCHMIL